MFKLLVMGILLYVFVKFFFKLMYPQMPQKYQEKNRVLELKACEYCGTLKIENECVAYKGHTFCSQDHARRFYL